MEADAQFTAGMDTKQYDASVSRMGSTMAATSARIVADMDHTSKATARMGSGVDQAAKKMYQFGQVSMQLQDVAVQLQSGTKFATVFAQQGSQMASAFGPQGAILGGAIAIGAAIYTWATGAEEANKKFKEGETRLKEMQAAAASLRSGAEKNSDAAATATIKDPNAKALTDRRLAYEREIQQIQKEGLKSGDAGTTKMALNAAKERYEAERAAMEREWTERVAEKTANQEAKLEAIRQRGRDADKASREMNLTAAEKLRTVEMEIAAIKNRTVRSGTARDNEQELESQTKLKEKQLERKELQKEVSQDRAKFQGMQEKEFDRLDKFDKDRRSKLSDMQSKEADRVSKVTENQEKMDRLKATRALDQQAAVGDRVLDRASRIRAGVSSSDMRREARKQASAERRAINQEIDEEDRNRRKRGLGGLTEAEKKERREGRQAGVQAAKNKDVIKASIDPDAIQELAKKIAEENAKLITK